MEDAASGWADLGNPERVISTLDRIRSSRIGCVKCEVLKSQLDAQVQLRHQIIAPFQDLVTVQ